MRFLWKSPNYDILEHAYELGGARRIVIYMAKVLQGAAMAALFLGILRFIFGPDIASPHVALFAVMATAVACFMFALIEKIQGLIDNAPGYNGAINLLDWACDISLMMMWTVPFSMHYRRLWAILPIALWALTWPWSQE
jgi:hypothetical protein